ncbi:MAG: bifunctional aspartate kinase/homoserine dehydrogenase I [Deltaproteobacteria bacterium]|nr:bifunctional aspartate kinase/homoserine dehydrogenase I [Deltaproteobacteria bacterium]
MRVMKFGGTSVGSAQAVAQAADLAIGAARKTRVLVVTSAAAGVTNLLVEVAHAAAQGGDADDLCAPFVARQRQLAADLRTCLQAELPGLDRDLGAVCTHLRDLVHGVALLRDCSPHVLAHLSGLGERAAVVVLDHALRHLGMAPAVLDPVEMLRCSGDPLAADPDEASTRDLFAPFRDGDARLGLMAGFFGGDARGKVMSLGRGGSDWAAALAAAAVDADLLEIWTDVAGIYSADPRVVPEAVPVAELSFAEAAELAHFGAKVLHPKTIAPARRRGIAVRVCDTFHPDRAGTWIRPEVTPPEAAVRGITVLGSIALVNTSGAGMPGVPGVAARLFRALADEAISVILITQASSECAISLCVRGEHAQRAQWAIAHAFAAELASGRLDPVQVVADLAVVSVVGEGMRHRVGVAGTFLSALGQVGCNVVALAQGSSELSISAVVAARDADRALRHAHHRFLHTREVVELYLCGMGTVGGQLLAQLAAMPPVAGGSVELRLCGVATTRAAVLDPQGIDPTTARARMAEQGQPRALQALLDHVAARRPDQPILVDCTSSQELAAAYPDILAAGMHVVSASKHANSAGLDHYRAIRRAARRHGRQFLYETNVGAGLPVIDTLRNLLAGGDEVLQFEGVLSGSMSYLLGLLQDGVPFAVAVRDARDKGFTEPDPRDDLSGLDVARKVLILARETGLALEMADVQVQGLLPAWFDATGDVATFLARAAELDAHFASEIHRTRDHGEVLRFVARFGSAGCCVGVQGFAADHPIAAIRGGENAFSFLTRHYNPRPLVVRGYGAGAEVTAAGVLADVVKVAVAGSLGKP